MRGMRAIQAIQLHSNLENARPSAKPPQEHNAIRAELVRSDWSFLAMTRTRGDRSISLRAIKRPGNSATASGAYGVSQRLHIQIAEITFATCDFRKLLRFRPGVHLM